MSNFILHIKKEKKGNVLLFIKVNRLIWKEKVPSQEWSHCCVDVDVWADSSSFMWALVFGLQIPCSVKPISGTLWNDCPVMAASFGMYYNVIRRGYIAWYNVRHIVACGFTMWTNITLRNKMTLNKSIPSGFCRKHSFPFCCVCMGVVGCITLIEPHDFLHCRVFLFCIYFFFSSHSALGETRGWWREKWRGGAEERKKTLIV